MSRTSRIVRACTVAPYVVAGAGLVAAVALGLVPWTGESVVRFLNLGLAVMTLAIAPLVLAFYELGDWTPPRWPGQPMRWDGQPAWSRWFA